MIQKTIDKVLNKKFNKWIASITDKEVKDAIQVSSIITGGAFVSLMENEEPNDFDIYFKSKKAAKVVAEYYIKEFTDANPHYDVHLLDENEDSEDSGRLKVFVKSSGIAKEEDETTEAKEYRPKFLSANAITLSDKIQLIFRFYGVPEEIHKNYDFEHTKAYWTSWTRESVIPARVWELASNKTLIYSGSLYPVCSVFRIRKFLERGWTINAGQIFKMAYQISKLDLDNRKVLEDQLVGVDSSFFAHFLHKLKKWQESHKEEAKDKDLFSTYLMQLIDEVF